jgi:hypothetical protein
MEPQGKGAVLVEELYQTRVWYPVYRLREAAAGDAVT